METRCSTEIPRKAETRSDNAEPFKLPQGVLRSPEEALQKLATASETATPSELQIMASMALSAFRQCCSTNEPPLAAAFVSLLTVLGTAKCWDVALEVYVIVPVQVIPPSLSLLAPFRTLHCE